MPDSLEPDDTILAKLGRGDIGPEFTRSRCIKGY